jgi:hypothetical protein
MATSGRDSSVVGCNVQIAVEANHHLIVMHEVTNDGTDRSRPAKSRDAQTSGVTQKKKARQTRPG